MKEWLLDPVVLGTLGVLVVGFILLVLAIRALMRSPKKTSGSIEDFTFPTPRNEPPLTVVSPNANPFATHVPTPPAPPINNREIVDKVDLISQRLVDMQMLLNKQLSAPQQGGGGALTLSGETLDKLIKMTAVVIQQVDVLQKAMGPSTGENPAMTAGAAPAKQVIPPHS